jgi:hypothetical protein
MDEQKVLARDIGQTNTKKRRKTVSANNNFSKVDLGFDPTHTSFHFDVSQVQTLHTSDH